MHTFRNLCAKSALKLTFGCPFATSTSQSYLLSSIKFQGASAVSSFKLQVKGQRPKVNGLPSRWNFSLSFFTFHFLLPSGGLGGGFFDAEKSLSVTAFTLQMVENNLADAHTFWSHLHVFVLLDIFQRLFE